MENIEKFKEFIKQLSKMPIRLLQAKITNDEYNEAIKFINKTKEYLINMDSYNNIKKVK